MKPSQRKEMALCAVQRHGVSVALACCAFSISETYYRYVCKLSDENEEIAHWLVKLTETKKVWGAACAFCIYATCMALTGTIKGLPNLLRVGTEPTDQITQAPSTIEAGATDLSRSPQLYMDNGLHGRPTG